MSGVKKYTTLPYSVEFRGDDWEAEMQDFAAACAADLPSFVLCRMVHEISLVLHQRQHDVSSEGLINSIETASLELSRRAMAGEDLDD
jgi:hypothetical protein